jgi:hypothetical protein
MPVWPDEAAVRGFLARARRRRAWVAGVEGAGWGALASTTLVFMTEGAVALAVAAAAASVLGAALRLWLSPAVRQDVALSVERRAPECRNVVVTTAELLADPGRVRPDVGARVCRDAARAVAGLDPRRLFPAGRAGGTLLAAAAVWTVALWAMQARPVPAATSTGDGGGPAGPAIIGVTAEITPPAYSGRQAETLAAPEEIRALAGSQVRLTIDADASAVHVETIDGARAVARDGTGAFIAEMVAARDGFVAFEPRGPDDAVGPRRLLALVVEPDVPPRVRISEPGRDLFLADASTRLPLGVEADDDLGLASLAVTYTRVTGSGENFDFVSGEVPLATTRTSGRSWTATGTLALDALQLEPGDLVVYRGVAADHRPGSPPVESDAFIIEILAPGDVAGGGFAIDDQHDRYALSQRMVLIKTERLAARRGSLAGEALIEEAQIIAAEQRQVRAEFVFMMGGELTDFAEDADPFILHEEDEAHGEADIAAGRLVNQGRAQLTRAVRAMSQAATALSAGSLDDALEAERIALEALQAAFSSSRYILRTLTERESIDLERRLTGILSETARGGLRPTDATGDPAGEALRRALADVIAFTAEPAGARTGTRAVVLAQAVLAIDPSSAALREVAGALADAGRAVETGNPDAAARYLDDATAALAAAARAGVAEASGAAQDPRTSRLRGAQADAAGRGGGRP